MKKFSPPSFIRSRYAWAVVAGIMLACSFPKPSLAGLAWVAPGLILLSALGKSVGSAFRLGYVAGLAHYLTSLYWLLFIPFPLGAVAAWLALSAYLALYPAVWVWLGWKCFPANRRLTTVGDCSRALQGEVNFQSAGKQFLSTSWRQRAVWTLECAILWVALELIVGRFLTGFPWNFLGVSQYQTVPLIQIASVTGVYGVSFLVVWWSVSLSCAALVVITRPTAYWAWLAELVLPGLALAGVMAFGLRQTTRVQSPTRELKVALVQPSIPQTLIWDPKEKTNRFNKLMELSRLALASKPDVLIWPEAALPNIDALNFASITNLIRAHHVWMIFGADDVEPRAGSSKPDDDLYFNASFLINPSGEVVARYRKRRLVIFGEYVPLTRWLPFLKYFTPIEDGFASGDRSVPFRLSDLRVTTSVLICFEDVFPHLAREDVQSDTDFLLNLTNNGWFGESAAQWQHAANAAFRAVENGLPLVRCTNNGLTCWIDSGGRMHEIYFGNSKDIYGDGFKTARIPLLDPGQKREPTFYRQYGDWFGWGCVGLAVAIVISPVVRQSRKC